MFFGNPNLQWIINANLKLDMVKTEKIKPIYNNNITQVYEI